MRRSRIARTRGYCVLCIVPDGGLAPNDSMSKTVLIADDSATMRLTVRLLMEGRNAELDVREAVDGVDAIEKAEMLKPDLIVLDLAMPRLNGAEAASVLKKTMPDTPIILFTLYSEVGRVLSTATGVEVISKTDDFPRLLERVDTLFGSSAESERS